MGQWTSGNDVEYLFDGVATFRKLIALMDWAGTGHQGYVHISMWECNPYTDLDGAGTLFWQKIKALADGGTEIRILLWKPGTLENYWGPDFVRDTTRANETCKRVIETNNPPPVAVVTLADHPDVEGAYHEKTMIFCNGDEVRCIVGGLNIANVCRDQTPHAPRPNYQVDFSGYPNWHDVAVVIRGPATNDIEADFIQRWNLNPPSPAVPVGRRDSSAFTPGNQGVSADQSLRKPETMDILTNLRIAIEVAEDFLYFENYSIHDPIVLKHVVRWIRSQRAARKPHDVILVVPFPTAQTEPVDWLHFFTYCRIGFEQCDLFRYDDAGAIRTVARSASVKWRFHDSGGDWHWGSSVEWSGGRTSIRSLRGFYVMRRPVPAGRPLPVEITPIYTPYYFAAPTNQTPIYVHSKVFIAGQQSAAVGSANFNPRSLHGHWRWWGINDPLDGELTAFIMGDSVDAFRQALWSEWFTTPPGPSTWSDIARLNERTISLGQAVGGRIYMLPVYNRVFTALYPRSTRKLLTDVPNMHGTYMDY